MIAGPMYSDILSLSTDLGFAAVGIASTSLLVSQDLTWSRSAICFAHPYPPPAEIPDVDNEIGVVAAFASGCDYHDLLSEKLNIVIDQLGTYLGKYSIHVDDIRIKERALAVRAGIGWIGRNRCLYVPGYGSYVVLGEILVSGDLEATQKHHSSMCRNCNLCISNCPTGALTSDGVNISKCISHLTQKRSCLDIDMYPLLNRSIYGCDICQKICPHNLNILSNTNSTERIYYPGPYVRLNDIISMNNAEWLSVAKGSSIEWIGRNTWRRNAIIAAGNTGSVSSLPYLMAAREDDSEKIRIAARWALERMCGI